ncbi:S8 family peptidase [Peribacillus huizhouensis]|uniref:Subtilisin n=1 Tax=Peribacillus huizhouensis TaxID=1501239 RepID=A0ABR6CS40_9BACI|nr:S8 family serine peptidase [Peribacillus huizhouensis]MBA9027833.1 subtilisin [Peribacillus huizhouensis]
MKKNVWLSTLFFLLFVLLPVTTFAEQESTGVSRQNVMFKNEIDYDLLQELDSSIIYEYKSIDAVTINLSNDKIIQLKNSPSVKSVYDDRSVQVSSQKTPWSHQNLNIPNKVPSDLTGDGIKIAIIDSGIDSTHPDLSIAGGVCVLDISEKPDACKNSYRDEFGHGTHVAGIIGAQDNNIGYVGIAPKAKLYAVKALNEEGEGSSSSLLAGIEWSIQHGIDIINLSLNTPEEDPTMKALLDKAYEKGILIVAAAGNEGNITGKEQNVLYPAKFSSVIAVSATNKNNRIISYSSVGKEVELSAPGDAIASTYPISINKTGYETLTGTSMAAPHVTALAALYMEKYPNYTNKQIRQKLQDNAKDLGAVGRDALYGYGLAQVDRSSLNGLETKVITEQSVDGQITLTITSLPLEAESYNLYRFGRLILENETSNLIEDYGKEGEILYQLVPVSRGGEMLDQTYTFTVKPQTPIIPDLNNEAWYSRNVMYLHKSKIIQGNLNGLIMPNKLVTRAEAVSMLGRALGYSQNKSETVFKDVSAQSFASGYIQQAYEKGILQGFPDRTFRPDQNVTRAEMAILLSKAYKLSTSSALTFKDVSSNVTGNQAINLIATAGITQGYEDGTFRPYALMSRSNYAVFLSKANNSKLK